MAGNLDDLIAITKVSEEIWSLKFSGRGHLKKPECQSLLPVLQNGPTVPLLYFEQGRVLGLGYTEYHEEGVCSLEWQSYRDEFVAFFSGDFRFMMEQNKGISTDAFRFYVRITETNPHFDYQEILHMKADVSRALYILFRKRFMPYGYNFRKGLMKIP